jgi:hypothetical protein
VIDTEGFLGQVASIKKINIKSSRYNANLIMQMNKQNDDKKNETKIYKMMYSNEDNDDWLFEPKYAFGLTEYQMIILRIYVNICVTIYFIILMMIKN